VPAETEVKQMGGNAFTAKYWVEENAMMMEQRQEELAGD